ncbi:hypothetical protein TWF718_010816 [Orbilia javanica]|uniref:Uncharacterized protein n=1 Tax=Orbilia javanica TaxID=47235 RepID=A0AAN8MUV4_9PEZI
MSLIIKVTIYADLYCSQKPLAKEINIGDCANLNGMLVRSFSVDECPPGTPDYTDILGNSTTTASSIGIPSATSSTIPPSSTPTQTSPPSTNSGSSNRMAIIGGAVGGGVGLFMIVVSLIGWFLYKRNLRKKKRMGTGWSDVPEGYGRCTGDGGPGHSGYNIGSGYSGLRPTQEIGELEATSSRGNLNAGNSYFKDQSPAGIRQKRVGGATRSASGSGIFENQVADDVALREIPRQELEAPVPIQIAVGEGQQQKNSKRLLSRRDRLPEMPKVPAVGQ